MSQDIRNFFISSKQSAQKKTVTVEKSRKKAKVIESSDEEDEKKMSHSKKKTVDSKKSKTVDTKEHKKKRAVLSSDEDEAESKHKKLKVTNDSKKNSNHVEKPLEEVDISTVFEKKPIKRINAPKITKKSAQQSTVEKKVEKPTNSVSDFMNEDDDFDATLEELDTSKYEDEYLAAINNKESTSSFFESKEKHVSDSKKEKDISNKKHETVKDKQEKDASSSKNKEKEISSKSTEKEISSKSKEKEISSKSKEKEISPKSKEKDKDTHKKSPSKSKSKDKDNHVDAKKEKSKDKKDRSHPKLEIDKTSKKEDKANDKSNDKSNDVDYNEIIQEKVEKKKQNAALYHNYLNRGGARNPGSKEVPQGAERCLSNLSFLITGVLDSLEREEAEGIIKQYGGKIIHSISKKLDYIIVGDEPGPSKMVKAESLNIKKITEDGLLDLIRTRPAGVSHKLPDNSHKRKRENSVDHDDHKSSEKIKKIKEETSSKESHKSLEKPKKDKEETPPKESHKSSEKVHIKKEEKEDSPKNNLESPETTTTSKDLTPKIDSQKDTSTIKTEEKTENKAVPNGPLISDVSNKLSDSVDHLTALVEKYRPKEIKQIIGQNGDKSPAKKLLFWLSNWHKNHGKNSKGNKPKFSARDDTGTIYKAALLSGPPGIGKTTTAYVACAELGFEILEFNASDTRSKKLLQEEIAGILSNKTVRSYMTTNPDKNKTPKHVLVMDEVDGMAGNEDRGGMQELIAFIKSTEIPIICICNDRQSPKIRTLSNYTFDLRYQKPRLEQIRASMMSICFKEGIKVTPDELTKIIQSTNQDIRQVINHIAVLAAKSQTAEEKEEFKKYKNLKLGPWEVVRKVFSAEDQKNMSIHDKSDLFFHDYNIAPLFVEENYLIVSPSGPKNEIYDKIAKCSESLAIGDTIEKCIRSSQSWSLLPVQACFSSVIPGTVMAGFITSQINFPSWLGKNSKTNKCDRLLQDITVHARLTTGASKEAINLDYIKMLVDSIIRPLAVEGVDGVDKAVEIMNNYHLSREDLDSLIELTKWPHTRDPMQSVDTKTKTAFTKAYNKSASFSSAGTMKKKSTRDTGEDYMGSDEEIVDEDDEDDEKLENDKLIKAKTSKATKASSSESKGKAKGTSNRGRKKK